MNPNRTLALVFTSVLCQLLAFSSLNGHAASAQTVQTCYQLDGKDSIVTTVDGKVISTRIVQKENAATVACPQRNDTAADTIPLVPENRISSISPELDHQYRMKILEYEQEKAKLELKTQESIAKIKASNQQRHRPYAQSILILLICIGLPLLLTFAFLSYRLRLKNKRNNDFEKFLAELVKTGQPISPELINALRTNKPSKTSQQTSCTITEDSGCKTRAEMTTLDENRLKTLEKETLIYCSYRACLAGATLLLWFWALISHIDVLAVLLFIPFLIFLFQGAVRFFNFCIEKKYKNPVLPTETDSCSPETSRRETETPAQPAQPAQPKTEAPDTPIQPTL